MTNPNSIKQPFWQPVSQGWASDQISVAHSEALYRVGEYAMFVLMWNVGDFKAGLVGRCPICFGDPSSVAGRITAAYKQPTKERCVDILDPAGNVITRGCYGTTFEGGYRAKIIRPAIFTDSDPETTFGGKGEFVKDSMTLETTTDFFSHDGDYVFRANGSRLRCQEMNQLVLRSGFGSPGLPTQALGGVIPAAVREETSSVAFSIPPTSAKLTLLLNGLPAGRHTPADLAVQDDLRGPLIV